MPPTEFIIIWCVCAIAATVVAAMKGKDPWIWLIIGLILGVIALGITIVMKKEDPRMRTRTFATPWICPKCRHRNGFWNSVCPKCGTKRS